VHQYLIFLFLIILKKIEQANYRGVILETSALWYPNFRSQKEFLQNKAIKLLNTRDKNKLFYADFLIHLRLGDILDPLFHKKETYFPLKIDYYKKVSDKLGKTPVFIGQLSRSNYLDELKKNFPNSEFHNPDPITTFLSIMTAKKKVLSLSTFCWFAAWCGKDDTKIHLPVTSFYNPITSGKYLFPFDDERYIFDYLDKDSGRDKVKIGMIGNLKKIYNILRLKYIVTKYPEN